MDSSNSDNLSQPHPIIHSDWDFSDWDVNLNEWELFTQYDQINDDLFLTNNPASTKCPGSDHTTESHHVAREAEQNMSLNEWELLVPESLDITEMLAKDPDLDPLSTTHDLPLEPPVIVPPFEPLTLDALETMLQQSPPPPRSDPSPDGVPLVVPDWLDRQVTMDDFHDRNQAGSKPANSPNVTEEDISFDIGQSLAGSNLPTPQEPLRSQVHPVEPVWTSRSAEPSRCAPCRFANIPMSQCNGSVGSTCTRCERLRSKVNEKVGIFKSWFGLFTSPSEPALSLPQIIYFELMETQKLLVALRGEVDQISSLSPGHSLESLFDGNMLWHIDDKATFSAYSKSVSTIAVKRLATTRAETEAQPNGIVAPAMDAVQLDTFIDQRRPARETKGLADVDRETLTIAWRCAYWLIVLLRWDSNEIYVNQAGHDALPLVDAKNLVLELAYSIAHRIQVLIKKLCHRADRSLNGLDKSLDPGTICCALWIVFSATRKFEKHNFRAKSLKSLFIEDAKKPKATVTFAAERHVSHPFFMNLGGLFDSGLQPQSFSDILESEVLFQDDIDLFLGRPVNRNLAALRPSDRAALATGELPRAQSSLLTSTTPPLTFSNLSKLSSDSSIGTPKSNCYEARKRALSDEGNPLSLWRAKRIR
ncbi:hypothetical protein FANTH_3667 [Fusarium anthophilum]|uniref:Uncharacterized protein n=1 Tax=Fusarium anthophilum TaxID=48485 RepID=A0A8H4ZR26_9HYPO|nr:hypothetical protein FANTH_3667 [Fusarium anthophilum]